MFQWGASPNMWTVFFQSRKDGNEVTVFVAEFKWTHKGQNREKKSKKDKQQKSQHCYPIFAHCQRKTKRKLIHFAAKIYQDKNTDTGHSGFDIYTIFFTKGVVPGTRIPNHPFIHKGNQSHFKHRFMLHSSSASP